MAAKFNRLTAIHGLLAGCVLMAMPSLVLLAAILLAPGLLCLAIETAPGRPNARAALLCASGFGTAPLWHLWQAGPSFAQALTIAATVTTLAPCWCAACAGWLAAEIVPFAIRLYIDTKSSALRTRLLDRRTELITEWNITLPDQGG